MGIFSSLISSLLNSLNAKSLIAAKAMLLLFILISQPAQADVNAISWDHNGSHMITEQNGNDFLIKYEDPRAGLQRVGVYSGTVLFRGTRQGSQLWGTAYVFRNGCAPAAYQVAGTIRIGDGSEPRIVLSGAAPIRAKGGCAVVRYSNKSSNAVLVFTWAGASGL